jgi:hypothetical protein
VTRSNIWQLNAQAGGSGNADGDVVGTGVGAVLGGNGASDGYAAIKRHMCRQRHGDTKKEWRIGQGLKEHACKLGGRDGGGGECRRIGCT